MTCARLSPVIFCTYRRTSPFTCLLCFQYSCSQSVRLIQAYTSDRLAASNCTSSVASRKARICSRLNRSPFLMLTFNPQHAEPPPPILQAHLALESNPSFRLILHWTRLRLALDRDMPYNEGVILVGTAGVPFSLFRGGTKSDSPQPSHIRAHFISATPRRGVGRSSENQARAFVRRGFPDFEQAITRQLASQNKLSR